MGLFVAVVSAILGALLAGAANLRLAQRAERRIARAGVEQLKADLRSAEDLIRAFLAQGVWWDASFAPSTTAWDQYHDALVAQLDPRVVAAVQKAINRLRDINRSASLSHKAYADDELAYRAKRAAEVESRARRALPGPDEVVARDAGFRAELENSEPSLALSNDDRDLVQGTLPTLDAALGALRDADTERLLREPLSWRERGPFMSVDRAFMTTLVVAFVVVAVGVVSWILAPTRTISPASVARTLSSKLNGAQSVACVARPGQIESGWTCLASFSAADGRCPRVSASEGVRSPRITLAAVVIAPSGEERPPGCGGLEQYQVKTLVAQKAAIADKIRASGGRLESGDPQPRPDGSNLQSGMVPVPVNDNGDSIRLSLANPGKRPWWMFWR